MSKELRCGDVMPGCEWVVRGESEEEVLAEGAKHAAEAHGLEEIDEATLEKVKEAVREV